MSKHLEPLAVAEILLGGIETVARASGRDEKAAYHWRHANTARDAGDIPSARNMRGMLTYSDTHGLGLKPEHLIWGAPAAEIEALLEEMRRKPAPDVAAE